MVTVEGEERVVGEGRAAEEPEEAAEVKAERAGAAGQVVQAGRAAAE